MRTSALIILLAFVLLTSGCTGQGPQTGDAQFTGTLPQTAPVEYTDEIGDKYTVEGYPGYVYVFAELGTEKSVVEEAVKANGGTIIDSVSGVGIYTVKVGAGQEEAFLLAMYKQTWFLDGSPAFEFMLSDIFMYDHFSGAADPSDCTADHGDLDKLKAERLGGAVDPIDKDNDIKGTWTVGMARSIIAKAEAAEKRGAPAVFSLSLQSQASHDTAITAAERATGCVSINCQMVRNGQRNFFNTFFQTMESEIKNNPKAADNMLIVIAAGNAGADLDGVLRDLKLHYPNAYKRIKLVGGSFENGDISERLNHITDNSKNDVAYARGERAEIYNPATGTTTMCDGTSFAAPEVSAVLNEIWMSNPTLTSEQVINAFNQALSELGVDGVLPQDEFGETPVSFIERAVEIGGILASGGTINGGGGAAGGGGGTSGGGNVIFVGPPTLTATVGKEFSYSLCLPSLDGAGATCGGLVPSTNPTGGSPPYSVSVKIGGGFMPPGIALNLNGFLSGTPTQEGNYPFQVCARDGAGLEGCANVVINVEPAAPTETTYSGSFSASGQYDKYDGCSFSDTFSGTISMDLTENGDAVSGTATISGTFTSTALSSPDMCLNSQVSMNGAATVSGTKNNLAFTHHFYTAGGSDYAGAFTGSLSGNTITGTFGETSTCCSGSASTPVTLTAQ
jgi:hypothetical protein